MESPTANSVLTLHGWPSKHLRGTKLPWLLLSSAMFCAFMAPLLRSVLSNYLAIRLPYVVTLAIMLVVWCPLVWQGRWPLVPKNSLPTWQLDLSPKGFAARRHEGQADWRPWSPAIRVSFRRVRPDFCRVRILEKVPSRPFDPEVVDLVVACEDQVFEQVVAYIQACREGQEVEAPVVESASLSARSAAKRARSPASADQEGALGLEQCPQCGYDLAGLPVKGQCPECGFEYDAEAMIVLYGRNASTPGYMPVSVFARFGFVFVLITIANIGGDYLSRRLGIPVWTRSFVVGTCMLALLGLLEYRSRDPNGPRRISFFRSSQGVDGQLRLSPAGFGIRLGYGVCLTRPWSDRMHLHIDRLEGSTYRLQINNSPQKVRFRSYVWARLDVDADERTVNRILERVTQWRQTY